MEHQTGTAEPADRERPRISVILPCITQLPPPPPPPPPPLLKPPKADPPSLAPVRSPQVRRTSLHPPPRRLSILTKVPLALSIESSPPPSVSFGKVGERTSSSPRVLPRTPKFRHWPERGRVTLQPRRGLRKRCRMKLSELLLDA